MKPFVMAVFLISALAACSAGDVPRDTMEPDAGGDPIIETVPLQVDPPEASTYWNSIPVSGKGPADGTLLYTTPGGGQFTATLGASGDFCVDVILQKNATNSIKFEAINADGKYAEPVVVSVRQSGDAPQGDPPTPVAGYSNIASGATITKMSVSIEEGTVAALVDGDSSGVVSIRNTSVSSDWMVLELTERLPIQQIRIKTAIDCPMESYRILLNDDAQSGDPIVWSWAAGGLYVYGSGWVIVADVSNGSADQTITPFIGDPKARRLAIEFLSSDCGPVVGAGRHRVTEIEVWGRGASQPPPPGGGNGAPSCSSL